MERSRIIIIVAILVAAVGALGVWQSISGRSEPTPTVRSLVQAVSSAVKDSDRISVVSTDVTTAGPKSRTVTTNFTSIGTDLISATVTKTGALGEGKVEVITNSQATFVRARGIEGVTDGVWYATGTERGIQIAAWVARSPHVTLERMGTGIRSATDLDSGRQYDVELDLAAGPQSMPASKLSLRVQVDAKQRPVRLIEQGHYPTTSGLVTAAQTTDYTYEGATSVTAPSLSETTPLPEELWPLISRWAEDAPGT